MPQTFLLKNGDNMFKLSSVHVCDRQLINSLYRITNITMEHPMFSAF